MIKIYKLFLVTLFFVSINSCGQSNKAERKDLMNNELQKTNKLINEKSPYLLQHSHNPVDWYPWGE